MLSVSLRYAAWRWREYPNCLCFPLAKHPHIGAPPVSYRQDDGLAGFHAFPFYRWWIAATDGFLSLKIPVGRAWWIAPDCSSGHTPSDHPRHHHNLSKMWAICCWLIKYTYEAFLMLSQKSLEMSAVTNSIACSCVNTNKVGVKNIYTQTHGHTGGDVGSSGTVIILQQCTLMTDSLLSSVSFRQQLRATVWAWRPVMVAEAFNGSVTVSGLCRTLPFAEFKSVNQSVLWGGGCFWCWRQTVLFKTLSTHSPKLEQSNK